MIGTKEKIEYGKQTIEFNLYQEERKTLTINVLPNSDIRIKAPLKNTKGEIIEKIKSKAKWITKQQKYFEQNYFKPAEKNYISGETHLYLGKQYRLKIASGDKNSIKLKNGYFFIEHLNDDKTVFKALLNNWYKKRAKEIFDERLNACYQKFLKYDIQKPDIKILKLKKRWGSYNKKNNTIIINIDCVKVSKACIDYILIHELCHCINYSHNKAFYEILETVCPDWKTTKSKLETIKI